MMTPRRFTYGAQFTPAKVDLTNLLELCIKADSDREELKQAVRSAYFEGHGRNPDQRDENSRKMAMNCVLSLESYGVISREEDRNRFVITALGDELCRLAEIPDALYKRFAIHILTRLEGLMICRAVESIRGRGEQVTLEVLGSEFNELGIRLPSNSTYISTMKSWLVKAGVMSSRGYSVNWDVVYDLLGVERELIDNLFALPAEQKYFLMSLICLGAIDFTPSNNVAKHTREIFRIRLTTKNLVKHILEPLRDRGLIEIRKSTTGRGAKPHDVRLSDKGRTEILQPIIENIAEVSELTTVDLNRPFEDVVVALDSEDKHEKGIALELLAVWLIRLLSIRFIEWRMRSYESTGGGEVDLMAASDKIVYSRWQIQCKNMTSPVNHEVIAREVGITFLTKADVVMVITTSRFTRAAIDYANLVSDESRYYVILLDKRDIEKVARDRSQIVEILNLKARRTFARRELGWTDFDDQLIRRRV